MSSNDADKDNGVAWRCPGRRGKSKRSLKFKVKKELSVIIESSDDSSMDVKEPQPNTNLNDITASCSSSAGAQNSDVFGMPELDRMAFPRPPLTKLRRSSAASTDLRCRASTFLCKEDPNARMDNLSTDQNTDPNPSHYGGPAASSGSTAVPEESEGEGPTHEDFHEIYVSIQHIVRYVADMPELRVLLRDCEYIEKVVSLEQRKLFFSSSNSNRKAGSGSGQSKK